MKRTANIATIPERFSSLLQVLASIRGQFDEIRIYLNNYKHVPSELQQPLIKLARGANLTDNGKFFWLDKATNELYYTMDDDLIYPPDWADRLQAGATNGEIVTWHGRRLRGLGRSYYHDTDTWPCLGDVSKDTYVDVGGTGVMMIDTRQFRPTLWNSPHKCMADLVLAKEAARLKHPIKVLAHKAGELKLIPQPPMSTIYERFHRQCNEQNQLANEIWILKHGKPPPPRLRGYRW